MNSLMTVVRVPTTEELEPILALMNDPASIHRQVACRHGERLETADELYQRLAEDGNLVLEEEGRVVAYASWQSYGAHAHLNVMVVAGDRQRRGLGARLFSAFLWEAKQEGAESVSLRAYADSTWAIAFYAGLGMRHYAPGDEEALGQGGLAYYIRLAIENGQWPADDKVMFVGEIE
ncbi:MAG: N-acetyltransferase family protein [Candidatus Sericytochromatia bacterium]